MFIDSGVVHVCIISMCAKPEFSKCRQSNKTASFRTAEVRNT